MGSTPPRRLVLFKRAIKAAANGLSRQIQNDSAHTSQEKVEWVMAFIRAAAKVRLGRIRQ